MRSPEQFQRVLAAARSGEEWAVAELYRHLHPRLLRYLRASEPGDAEDLASEVWIAVASGLPRFEGDEASFRAWLFTIAQRRLIDLRRSAARRRTYVAPIEALPEEPELGGPEAEVLASEATEAALAEISSLPTKQAEVVLLRVVAGLSVSEVAEILGKRPGAIRVLQHRALRRLAQQLSRRPVTK